MKKAWLNKPSSLFAAMAIAVSGQSIAHNVEFERSCELKLNNELNITPQHVLIKEGDETLVDIYNDKVVFLRGNQINLTSEQQSLITQYSLALRDAVPQVAEIALEAVDVAFSGINAGLGNMVDLDDTREQFDEIKQRISTKYQQGTGYYSFSEGNFSSEIDDAGIDQAIEELTEELVPRVIGNILASIGTSLARGDTDFSQFDNIDERIEAEIDGRTEQLEKKAEAFCIKLKEADDIEESLIASNLKFMSLDLLNIKQH